MKHSHPIWNQLKILKQNRDIVLDFLSQFTEAKIRQSPAYGWSMIQALRHIQVSESTSISYINKKKLGGPELKKRTYMPRLYLRLIDIAFRSGLKFKAPSVLKDPIDSPLEDLIKDWDNTREELMKLVENYPDEWEMKAVYKHPFAGMLNITDAIRFFNIHQNQHIRQVHRIAKHLTK